MGYYVTPHNTVITRRVRVIHLLGIQVTGVSVNLARSFGRPLYRRGKALALFVAPAIGVVLADLMFRGKLLEEEADDVKASLEVKGNNQVLTDYDKS